MAKNLVIVESPAKAKTIKKYLGRNYVVKASMGHVRDLPKSTMGVTLNGDVEVKYLVPREKKDVIKDLREELKKAEVLWLATDLDREGEAIAWHLAEALKARPEQIRRVTFNEITKEAIKTSFRSPRDLAMPLVDAQQARRVIDRFVGYRLSPVLWDSLEGGRALSAGRVQSVTVRLLVDRQREIEAFSPEQYFSIHATLQERKQHGAAGTSFDARLVRAYDQDLVFVSMPRLVLTPETDGKRAKDTVSYTGAIADPARVEQYVTELEGATYVVGGTKKTKKKRRPTPPFTTSTLQQEASRKLGFGARKTMGLAQRLYEGLPMPDEGQVGLITYMRTDSVNIAASALAEIASLVQTDYGDKYTDGPRSYKTKAKGAQEAHEAVRPTEVARRPDDVAAALAGHAEGKELARLYRLIWQRTVASQMADAQLEQVTVEVGAFPQSLVSSAADISETKAPYLLRSSGQTVVFDGFLRVYAEGNDDEEDVLENRLPDLLEGAPLVQRDLTTQRHETKAAPLYTEASLVKKLEQLGIGRPSTYAPTIGVILEREYAAMESKRLVPSELGAQVNDFLVKNFPDYVGYAFTARMEDNLDRIAEGLDDWKPAVRAFHNELERRIDKVMGVCPECGGALEFRTGFRGRRYIGCANHPTCEFTRRLGDRDGGAAPVALDEMCPRCRQHMLVKKKGRYGWFIACTGYPDCNYSRPTDEDLGEQTLSDENCEKCGADMVYRRGRYGPFLGCSKYPGCKTIKRIEQSLGVACPQCEGGELVKRQTKRGKTFYGCNKYPDCDFVVWEKPHVHPCPECAGLLTGAGDALTCQSCKKGFATKEIEGSPEKA